MNILFFLELCLYDKSDFRKAITEFMVFFLLVKDENVNSRLRH